MAKTFRAALATAAALVGASSAQAQLSAVPPVTSIDAPPPHGIALPPFVRYDNPYYGPVGYYPIPNQWVAYAAPSAMIVAPSRVSFGPFGRTYVRSRFFRASW